MGFAEIFCQERAVSTLQKAWLTGKFAHAYIFAGMEGVGKFRTAREWAKLLLCKESTVRGEFADSCGVCESCKSFEAGSHPDFQIVYKELREFTKDGKGKAPPVDLPIAVIREFLVNKVAQKPTFSARKVFVVNEAERLNNASQNALLKTLEEPPEYCSIILLCTKLERLLPTTKSRCQTIRFGPVGEEKIIENLEATGLENVQAEYFGRLAEGSLGLACKWAKLELSEAGLYQTKRRLIESFSSCALADSLELAGRLLKESKKIAGVWCECEPATSKTDIGRRAAKYIVRIVISAFSDAMKITVTPGKNIINFDQEKEISVLAKRFGDEGAAEKIADCYKILRWIDASVNEKLIYEHLLLNSAVCDTMRV